MNTVLDDNKKVRLCIVDSPICVTKQLYCEISGERN